MNLFLIIIIFLEPDGAPLSAAEKQRRYRARRDADPLKRQQYLEKEKEKWRKDVETGKKLLQNDRTKTGQRAQRKKWKEWHERSKARKKRLEGLSTPPLRPACPVTPPFECPIARIQLQLSIWDLLLFFCGKIAIIICLEK